jgi:NADH:ubiquinone oxidoreductase subunit 2 (subunit N)
VIKIKSHIVKKIMLRNLKIKELLFLFLMRRIEEYSCKYSVFWKKRLYDIFWSKMFLYFNSIFLINSMRNCYYRYSNPNKFRLNFFFTLRFSQAVLFIQTGSTLPHPKTFNTDIYFLIPEIFLFCAISFSFIFAILKLRVLDRTYTNNIFLFENLELTLKNYKMIVLLINLFKTLTVGVYLLCRRLSKLFWFTIFLYLSNPLIWSWHKLLFNGLLITTPQIIVLKIFILLLGILIYQINLIYIFQENFWTIDYPIISSYLIWLFLIFIQINDFFILFVIFEMISMLFYVLLAIRKSTVILTRTIDFRLTKYEKFSLLSGITAKQAASSITATMIYFLYNLLMSGFFLFGLSCLFIIFRTTSYVTIQLMLTSFADVQFSYNISEYIISELYQWNIHRIHSYVPNIGHPLLLISLFLILIFFFFKLAVSPFHGWIGAVFEGASYFTLMILSIPFKFILILMFMKILYGVFNLVMPFCQLLIIPCALLSMIIGVYGMLWQSKIKRFWAYSTVNHMGYLMLGLSSDTLLGLRAVLIYLISYILLNLIFFIIMQTFANDNFQKRIVTISQFSLIPSLRTSFLGYTFAILIFSLMGIPPFLTFWGKYFIIMSIFISFSPSWFILALSIIFITSLLAAFAYLRIWKNIFMEVPYNKKTIIDIHPLPLFNANILVLLIMILIFGGFFGGLFLVNYHNFMDNFILCWIDVAPLGKI